MENKFVSSCEGCLYHKAKRNTHTCRLNKEGFWFMPGHCRVNQKPAPLKLVAGTCGTTTAMLK